MITSSPRIVVVSSLHPQIGALREARLYEEYEHVSFIEVDGRYIVIEPVTDGHPHHGDLAVEGRQSYAFVEDGECENIAQARTRCEEYERDWRSHDRAYEQQKRQLSWREFLSQPVDVQGLADAYGICETTILDYIDELAGARPNGFITNGNIVTLIERGEASQLVLKYGPSTIIMSRRMPSASERATYASASAELRQFFCGKVLGLLTEMILNAEAISFLAGGCRIAARGLQLWINASREQLHAWKVEVDDDLPPPPSSHLFMVTDRWYHPKHVVLEVEGVFLDAEGVQSAAELLAHYAARYKDPRLVAYNPAKLTRHHIRADRAMSWELAGWLARTFGPFRREWLFRKGETAA